MFEFVFHSCVTLMVRVTKWGDTNECFCCLIARKIYTHTHLPSSYYLCSSIIVLCHSKLSLFQCGFGNKNYICFHWHFYEWAFGHWRDCDLQTNSTTAPNSVRTGVWVSFERGVDVTQFLHVFYCYLWLRMTFIAALPLRALWSFSVV